MRGKYLFAASKSWVPEVDIFANKSALILEWILEKGIDKGQFSIREIVRDVPVSIGLTQKVFAQLLRNGFLGAKGVRTGKTFYLKHANNLLNAWAAHYNIVKKTKLYTYRSALYKSKDILRQLKSSDLSRQVVLALHTAAREKGFNNTTLNTIEFYLLDSKKRQQLEKLLELEPQERGYNVLIIEPYYKSMLEQINTNNDLCISSDLLTYLDLVNYPLRGKEQAEYLLNKSSFLRKIKHAKR